MVCDGSAERWFAAMLLVTAAAAAEYAGATFQPTLDKTGNAVGGTVTGRHWHEQKLASRIKGWQDCLQKYMSGGQDYVGHPPDPCFFGSAAAGSNQNPFATSTASPASLGAATQGQSTAATSPGLGAATQGQSSATTPPGAASANQDPCAEGASAASNSTSPASTKSSSARTTSKTVSRGEASNAAAAEPVPIKAQPIGPDPSKWQQTQDFPEGTRLTHDQAVLLLSGKGFHPR
ncbi:TPA: hypothetical protein ACH3X2_008756 [Trebouxia sp. C0005]